MSSIWPSCLRGSQNVRVVSGSPHVHPNLPLQTMKTPDRSHASSTIHITNFTRPCSYKYFSTAMTDMSYEIKFSGWTWLPHGPLEIGGKAPICQHHILCPEGALRNYLHRKITAATKYGCEGNNIFSYIFWGGAHSWTLRFSTWTMHVYVYVGSHLVLQLLPDVQKHTCEVGNSKCVCQCVTPNSSFERLQKTQETPGAGQRYRRWINLSEILWNGELQNTRNLFEIWSKATIGKMALKYCTTCAFTLFCMASNVKWEFSGCSLFA